MDCPLMPDGSSGQSGVWTPSAKKKQVAALMIAAAWMTRRRQGDPDCNGDVPVSAVRP